MGQYIFRFPANVPELTFEALSPLVTAACGRYEHCASCDLRVDTTVTVRWNARGDAVIIRLYQVDLAWVYADRVAFTRHNDLHLSTREWLERIVRDNGIEGNPWRVRRRKSDGPGHGGVLCLSGDRSRLVEGHTYPVDRARIEHRRAEDRRWAEMIASYNAGLVKS